MRIKAMQERSLKNVETLKNIPKCKKGPLEYETKKIFKFVKRQSKNGRTEYSRIVLYYKAL